MSHPAGALAWAEAQVAAVRDDPAARLALMARVFHGPTGSAPRHLPFRRAALSFMRWQARRGVLDPLDASPPGSVWWRAVNERLLRDGCETIALLGGSAGEPSSPAVRLWLDFGARPTGRNWYRAHNASIVAGYLEHRDLAEAESAPERFFMNVALRARALRARARRGAAPGARAVRSARPRARRPPARDGRRRSSRSAACCRTAIRSPLDVERYIADEQRLGRMLDYAVIAPRLQRLYEWSAEELGEPRLLRAGARRQPDLRLAVRAATRLAHAAHAARGPGARTRHARPLSHARDTRRHADLVHHRRRRPGFAVDPARAARLDPDPGGGPRADRARRRRARRRAVGDDRRPHRPARRADERRRRQRPSVVVRQRPVAAGRRPRALPGRARGHEPRGHGRGVHPDVDRRPAPRRTTPPTAPS